MSVFKTIHTAAIPRAIAKAERYRLLNEPFEAESICTDILQVEPDNQKALVVLILSLTDQFNNGISPNGALSLLPQLQDPYTKAYYEGIILERQGKSAMVREFPDSKHDAYEWLMEAMEAYEKADQLSQEDNCDARLRWNGCYRTISRHNLTPRPKEEPKKLHQPLE